MKTFVICGALSLAVVGLGATEAFAQYGFGGYGVAGSGFDYVPTFSPSATPYESFLRGEAEFLRAQAWAAKMAAEARSKAIQAEEEAMRLRQLKIAEKKAFYDEKRAKLDAYTARVRESQAKASAVRPVGFRAIDVERRATVWPAELPAERYATERAAIERAVRNRLTGDAIPSAYEAAAVVEPLRTRIDAEYQQKTIRFDQWVAARHFVDDVQKELRQPLPPVRLADAAPNWK
jgi:hypothetical protein